MQKDKNSTLSLSSIYKSEWYGFLILRLWPEITKNQTPNQKNKTVLQIWLKYLHLAAIPHLHFWGMCQGTNDIRKRI